MEISSRKTKTGIAYETYSHSKPPSALLAQNQILVVLVHGNGLCKSVWREFAKLFLSKMGYYSICLLSVDLGGHGESVINWKTRTRVSEFSSDILDCILDFRLSHHVDRTFFVGHSIGCQMGLFATRQELFRSALLIEPIIAKSRKDPGEAAKIPIFQGTLKRRREFPSFEDAYRILRNKGIFKDWTEESFRNYIYYGGFRLKSAENNIVELTCSPELEYRIFLMDASEIYHSLSEIPIANATVIYGTESYHVSRSDIEDITNLLPNGKFVAINGAHHIPMCELFNDVIVEETISLIEKDLIQFKVQIVDHKNSKQEAKL